MPLSIASSGPTDGSANPETNSARSLTCIEAHSAMFRPSISELRAAWLRRLPSHAGQGANVAARSTARRMCACSESTSLLRYSRVNLSTRPS